MQEVARKFNYSETTFVMPPSDPANAARVRIFTLRTEVPFAGHPNLGTAFLLANEYEDLYRGVTSFRFEEEAGIVEVDFLRIGGRTVGAELLAPEALRVGPRITSGLAADCL